MLTDFVDATLITVQALEAKRMDSQKLSEACSEHISSLVCLRAILNELSMVKKWKDGLDDIQEDEERRQKEQGIDPSDSKQLGDIVGEIEVSWRGQIEKVCFPLRPDIEVEWVQWVPTQ